MKRQEIILVLVSLVCALMPLATPVVFAAGVPSEITIQGRLTDAANNIVVDGVYAVTFKIYSDSTAGSALWFETQPVQVTGGLFAALLGHSTALPSDLFAAASEYYLGITVNLEPELPRVPLSSVAYSYQSKDADIAALALDLSCAGCVTVGEIAADAVGASEIAAGAVGASEIGTAAVGSDEIAADAITASEIANGAVGGLEIGTGAVGSDEVINGSLLAVDIDDGAVTTAKIATNAVTAVQIAADAVGSSEITTGAVGTGEVLDGSLTAVDIDDEPGVASNTSANVAIDLDGTMTTLLSRTLTAPAAGYVLVIATGEALLQHSSPGVQESAWFGVSTTGGVFPDNQKVEVRLDGDLPVGNYFLPVTVHGLFSTPGGSDVFYFLGHEFSGDVGVWNMQLTLIYFPTAHGTVVSTSAAGSESVPEE
jgi:hypothetical protein